MSEESFTKFYAMYPKQMSRGRARQAWIQMQDKMPDFQSLVAALQRAKKSEQWRTDNGKYIPLLHNWLLGECWDDINEVRDIEPLIDEPKVTNAWWTSEEATIEYGNKLGIHARPGESIFDYRARLKRAA